MVLGKKDLTLEGNCQTRLEITSFLRFTFVGIRMNIFTENTEGNQKGILFLSPACSGMCKVFTEGWGKDE